MDMWHVDDKIVGELAVRFLAFLGACALLFFIMGAWVGWALL